MTLRREGITVRVTYRRRGESDRCQTTVPKEYELAGEATATVDGPDGELTIRRRYEALPRHNDVVYPDGVDSNDEFVDRPDAVHVHTKCLRSTDEDEEYLLDVHDTVRPDDISVLAGTESFLEVCRERYFADGEARYARATTDRRENGA